MRAWRRASPMPAGPRRPSGRGCAQGFHPTGTSSQHLAQLLAALVAVQPAVVHGAPVGHGVAQGGLEIVGGDEAPAVEPGLGLGQGQPVARGAGGAEPPALADPRHDPLGVVQGARPRRAPPRTRARAGASRPGPWPAPARPAVSAPASPRSTSRSAAGIGVAQVQDAGEAVHLALRQREGAGMVHGVLGGDHEEGLGQQVGGAVQGHLALHHHLQQGALGLGPDAVQLVQEHDVGEHGPLLEAERLGGGLPQVDAQEVRGQEVVGALHPLVGAAQEPAEALGQGGLAHARQVLQQEVAPRRAARPRRGAPRPSLPTTTRHRAGEPRGPRGSLASDSGVAPWFDRGSMLVVLQGDGVLPQGLGQGARGAGPGPGPRRRGRPGGLPGPGAAGRPRRRGRRPGQHGLQGPGLGEGQDQGVRPPRRPRAAGGPARARRWRPGPGPGSRSAGGCCRARPAARRSFSMAPLHHGDGTALPARVHLQEGPEEGQDVLPPLPQRGHAKGEHAQAQAQRLGQGLRGRGSRPSSGRPRPRPGRPWPPAGAAGVREPAPGRPGRGCRPGAGPAPAGAGPRLAAGTAQEGRLGVAEGVEAARGAGLAGAAPRRGRARAARSRRPWPGPAPGPPWPGSGRSRARGGPAAAPPPGPGGAPAPGEARPGRRAWPGNRRRPSGWPPRCPGAPRRPT